MINIFDETSIFQNDTRSLILHLLDFKVSLSGPTSAAFVVAYGHELGLREGTEPVQAALYVAAKMLEAFGMLSHLSSEIAAAALALNSRHIFKASGRNG